MPSTRIAKTYKNSSAKLWRRFTLPLSSFSNTDHFILFIYCGCSYQCNYFYMMGTDRAAFPPIIHAPILTKNSNKGR